MSTYMSIPDYNERKGSLFLRSDHMNYSRATLNSNWHQARESEPKDYDLNKAPERDLCKATYDRIGNSTDGALPETTYENFSKQIFQKPDFTEKEVTKSMISSETAGHADIDRETGTPKKGYGAVLPTHLAGHNKAHFDTTHNTDYKPPFPYTPMEEKMKQQLEEQAQEFTDYTAANKRCHSQFTDTADYRRSGRNTWQDESGLYMNSHHKSECPTYARTNPFKVMEGWE